MDMLKNKKGFQIGDLLPIGITFVVLGVALSVGLQIQGDVKGDMTANSAEANASQDAIDANATVANKLPLIALVVVAAVLIGILVRYLMNRK
jgi:hypothetical protein